MEEQGVINATEVAEAEAAVRKTIVDDQILFYSSGKNAGYGTESLGARVG